MAIDDIIRELGRGMGLPLKLSEGRSCRIVIEDRYAIDIDAPAERPENVYLHAEVGAMPSGDDRGLCRKLLAANLFGHETDGATLALDESRGQIIAQRILPSDRLDLATLEAALTAMIGTAMAWQDRIARSAQEQLSSGLTDLGDVMNMIRI